VSADPVAQVLHDEIGLAVAAGLLLGIDEFTVQLDLEHTPAGWDQDDLVEVVLELFKYPLRQTDGSRCVASLSAVFDGDLHASTLLVPVD